jgi:hypothetical protein
MWYGHAVQKWQTRNVNTILWEIFESSRLEYGTEWGKVNESGRGSCPLAGFAVLNLGVLLPQCWLRTSLRIRLVRFLGMSQASLGRKMTAVGWKSGFWYVTGRKCFSSLSHPDRLLGPAQFPIHRVAGALSLGIKHPVCDCDYSSPWAWTVLKRFMLGTTWNSWTNVCIPMED